MTEQDRANREAAKLFPCSSSGNFGACRDERDPELCANCDRALAVAAKLRELYAEIERLHSDSYELTSIQNGYADLEAHIERLRAALTDAKAENDRLKSGQHVSDLKE